MTGQLICTASATYRLCKRGRVLSIDLGITHPWQENELGVILQTMTNADNHSLNFALELLFENDGNQWQECEEAQQQHWLQWECIWGAGHRVERLASLDGQEWWWSDAWKRWQMITNGSPMFRPTQTHRRMFQWQTVIMALRPLVPPNWWTSSEAKVSCVEKACSWAIHCDDCPLAGTIDGLALGSNVWLSGDPPIVTANSTMSRPRLNMCTPVSAPPGTGIRSPTESTGIMILEWRMLASCVKIIQMVKENFKSSLTWPQRPWDKSFRKDTICRTRWRQTWPRNSTGPCTDREPVQAAWHLQYPMAVWCVSSQLWNETRQFECPCRLVQFNENTLFQFWKAEVNIKHRSYTRQEYRYQNDNGFFRIVFLSVWHFGLWLAGFFVLWRFFRIFTGGVTVLQVLTICKWIEGK